ncbi:MAG: response regulator, partial [Rubrivivax sp.]
MASETRPAAVTGVQLERLPRAQQRLHILHLEDSEDDHALTVLQLRRAGLQAEFTRVDDLRAFEAALAQPWDAILSDYNLPGFTGLDALAVFRASGLVLPFILVSGEIGEDTAVEAMRSGASDYLLKQNLARLAPALERAIEASESRRARLQADRELAVSRQRLSELAQHLQTSIENERSAIS